MITIAELSKSFGELVVFDNLGLSIASMCIPINPTRCS